MGSIYKPRYKNGDGVYQDSGNYWIKYYRNGKPFRESSGSHRKRDAVELLKKREGAVASGTFLGLTPERTTFDEMAEGLLNDYLINQKKAIRNVRDYVKRLEKHFGGFKAVQITTDRIREYVAVRLTEETQLDQPPSNATLNRELSALKRMFNIAKKDGKVTVTPHVPMLAEKNVRKGFFDHFTYIRLQKVLPDRLKPVVSLAYRTGMRHGEVLSLTWDQVDFNARVIRLEPHTTKNDSPRIVPMGPELHDELLAQRQLRDQSFPFCKHVFFSHSTGRPIRDFRAAWKSACKKVGLKGSLFHDLRRCGVRNLVRAGVPERVAMAISGHKTRSVFDRYNIVNEDDIRAAGDAVDEYLGQSTGTVRAKLAEFSKEREVGQIASA